MCYCDASKANSSINASIIQKASIAEEVVWCNPLYLPYCCTKAVCELAVSDAAIEDAAQRLERFAPYIEKVFPETQPQNGLIESSLDDIPNMQQMLQNVFQCHIPGRLMLKQDGQLPIAGSVKARGGIYAVLKHAETLAHAHGLLDSGESYEKFAAQEMKDFFREFTIQVGSTGNLGMSIGIMSAALGFRVVVHMSSEAKQWKKELLRSRGVEVIEYTADYSRAVEEGRKRSADDPKSFFVDDERSLDLFLGYAVAAGRLKRQLTDKGIVVDAEHPLFVYLPAGVGGAPGGIAYGLKRLYHDAVHCFFVEPVQCPSVMLGIATQTFECANVRDFGLTGKTDADGLACASPSGLVTRLMTNLLSGAFTLEDDRLYQFMLMLMQCEQVDAEPSACAGFIGPVKLLQADQTIRYCMARMNNAALEQATHVVWTTGGRLVPQAVKQEWILKASGKTQ